MGSIFKESLFSADNFVQQDTNRLNLIILDGCIQHVMLELSQISKFHAQKTLKGTFNSFQSYQEMHADPTPPMSRHTP